MAASSRLYRYQTFRKQGKNQCSRYTEERIGETRSYTGCLRWNKQVSGLFGLSLMTYISVQDHDGLCVIRNASESGH